jgi:hypothetical protein
MTLLHNEAKSLVLMPSNSGIGKDYTIDDHHASLFLLHPHPCCLAKPSHMYSKNQKHKSHSGKQIHD